MFPRRTFIASRWKVEVRLNYLRLRKGLTLSKSLESMVSPNQHTMRCLISVTGQRLSVTSREGYRIAHKGAHSAYQPALRISCTRQPTRGGLRYEQWLILLSVRLMLSCLRQELCHTDSTPQAHTNIEPPTSQPLDMTPAFYTKVYTTPCSLPSNNVPLLD